MDGIKLPDDINNNLPDDINNNLPDDINTDNISFADIKKAIDEVNSEYYDSLSESESKLCLHCHKKIPKNSAYCPRCGVRFIITQKLYKEMDK